jgi:lysozyme
MKLLRMIGMTPESRIKLRNLLTANEKYSQFPYVDTTGHITVGIGRNLTDRGISINEALQLLDDDILYFSNKLASVVTYFDSLDDNRQVVLVNMCFNLGINGFLAFRGMLSCLEKRDFEGAAAEILQSKAAEQCPDRYRQLANIMKTGEL